MQLYNTLTHKKETFTPLTEGKVNMYVCGITAYGLCHIGHARSAVVFDVLVRYLRSTGLDVLFARNFTDVDDKIIKRANEEGLTSKEVAEKYIQTFYEDMDTLNILRADLEPKCTEHIDDMVTMCEKLIAKGKAYSTPSGDVYFRVREFKDYGKLSGRDVDDMRSGARIAPDDEKEDPLDFALWKSAKPGEPSWESPWGAGRPGWHIECSAMSHRHMPQPLDIHGGGLDLIFPHHENEIAQSEAANETEMARYWVHNGFVQIDSEKMSKSLGNFKTIRDILESYLPEVLRFFLLTKHYRSPIDFSFVAMGDAEKSIKRIYETKLAVSNELNKSKWSKAALPEDVVKEYEDQSAAFDAAMADDMNTAGATGHIFSIVRLMNRIMEDKGMRKSEGAKTLFERFTTDLTKWSEILGLFGLDAESFLHELKIKRATRKNISIDAIEELMVQRLEARKNKDFEAADTIRGKLTDLGVDVRDTPTGPVWDVL
jgi:cysteinyl-tRNA synthetase